MERLQKIRAHFGIVFKKDNGENMIYLSGAVRSELFNTHNIGFMLTPNMGNVHPKQSLWAADSGLYSVKGSRNFDLNKYLQWLKDRIPYQNNCLFVTAPDVVGDWAATKTRSEPILPKIRELGYKAALVAQDGLIDVRELDYDSFDCLFIGGTTEFKLSEIAYTLARDAKDHGKYIHMGRVNSWRRVRTAAVAGYDSVDGTFLAFGPDTNRPRLEMWLKMLEIQPSFVGGI